MRIISGICVCLVLLFSSCSEPVNQKIRIGYLGVTSNLPLFVALEQKLFEKNGIQVELKKFESSNLLGQALVNGEIDMDAGTSSFVGLALAQSSADKMKIFLSIIASEKNYMSSLLVSPNAGIDSVQQLKDKTIGCFPGAAIKTFTTLYLQKNNAWGEKSRLVELPPPLQLQALESKSADAVMCVEPIGTIARVTGKAKVLRHGAIEKDIFPDWVGGYYSFNSEYELKNAETATKVYDIFKESLQYIKGHMQDAKKTLMKYTPIQKEGLAQAVSVPDFAIGDDINKKGFMTVADTLVKYGVLKSKPTLQWFTKL